MSDASGDHSTGNASVDHPTGNASVDAAVSSLDELDTLPVSEHAEVFEAAHRELHAALVEPASDDVREPRPRSS